MMLPFFTIGHSNRSLETFIALLREADIGLVADIRTMPRSRAYPQFNKETLPDVLAGLQIGYEHGSPLRATGKGAHPISGCQRLLD